MSRRHAATSACMSAIRSMMGMETPFWTAGDQVAVRACGKKSERLGPVNKNRVIMPSHCRWSGPAGATTGKLPANPGAGTFLLTRIAFLPATYEGIMKLRIIVSALVLAAAWALPASAATLRFAFQGEL